MTYFVTIAEIGSFRAAGERLFIAQPALTVSIDAQFDEFVLPHLTRGHRGPMPKLPLRKIFNYNLKMLYRGCL